MGGITLNTTGNYQLSQWDGSDRIMREDFNADNRKTEEALTELAETVAQKVGPDEVAAAQMWVKIGESKLSSNAAQISLTLPNIAQYRAVQVYILGEGGYINKLYWGDESVTELVGGNRTAQTGTTAGCIDIYPAGADGTLMHYCIFVRSESSTVQEGEGSSARYGYTGSPVLSIRSANSSYQLKAGFSMTAYGLKP